MQWQTPDKKNGFLPESCVLFYLSVLRSSAFECEAFGRKLKPFQFSDKS